MENKKTFVEALESRDLLSDLTQVALDKNINIVKNKKYGFLNRMSVLPIIGKPGKIDKIVNRNNDGTIFIDDVATDSTIGDINKISFDPKRFTAKYSVTNNLIEAAGVNWAEFIFALGEEKIVEEIEKQILYKGTALGTSEDKAFQSLSKAANLTVVDVEYDSAEKTIKEKYAKLARNQLLNSSGDADLAWIIPTETLLDVENKANQSVFGYDGVPLAAYARLLGKPVFDGKFETRTGYGYILGAVLNRNAYAIVLSPIRFIQAAPDTNDVLKGVTTFIIECYADGKILDDKSIKLFGVPDSTPPTDVTGLAATPAKNSVGLTWVASASSDVVGYEIYNGAVLITTVTGTTYNVTGLTASTAYTFNVKAKDAAGNKSSGASVNTTTLA